jgi:hypothetical protein
MVHRAEAARVKAAYAADSPGAAAIAGLAAASGAAAKAVAAAAGSAAQRRVSL